jgi:hypothetical protein
MDIVEVPTKNPAAEQDVLPYIEQKQAESKATRKRLAGHTLIGVGIWAAASLLFPPAGVGGLVALAGIFYGSWFGWDLVTERGKTQSLELAKKEAQEDPSFAQTNARATADRKRYSLANNVALGALAVTGVAAVTMALAPLSIAAVIAALVLLASVTVGLVAGGIQNVAKGSYRAAEAVALVGERIFNRKKYIALKEEVARLKGQAPVTDALSPTASFDKAANSNAPPAPEAPKEAPPVIEPKAPKL